MATQFGRKVSLILGEDAGDARDLSDLRINFKVTQNERQTPNSAAITIYNVSDDLSQRIRGKEFTRVVLQAGYEENYGIVFDGSITSAQRARADTTPETDTCLKIVAADGDRAYNFTLMNKTLVAGATRADIITACADAMKKYGMALGYVPPLSTNPLPRGKVMFGLSRDYLETVACSTDTLWSIQNGVLQIVPEVAYAPGEVPDVNYGSGMLGAPMQSESGITVKMLLNPAIKIGRLIHLNNALARRPGALSSVNQDDAGGNASRDGKPNIDGYYKVVQITHAGDTRGNDWYTDVTCTLVDATSADTGISNNSA